MLALPLGSIREEREAGTDLLGFEWLLRAELMDAISTSWWPSHVLTTIELNLSWTAACKKYFAVWKILGTGNSEP